MRNNKYRLSIERDVLRVNGEGALSKQGFPKTISSDNKFIVEQDDNYLKKKYLYIQKFVLNLMKISLKNIKE